MQQRVQTQRGWQVLRSRVRTLNCSPWHLGSAYHTWLGDPESESSFLNQVLPSAYKTPMVGIGLLWRLMRDGEAPCAGVPGKGGWEGPDASGTWVADGSGSHGWRPLYAFVETLNLNSFHL